MQFCYIYIYATLIEKNIYICHVEEFLVCFRNFVLVSNQFFHLFFATKYLGF